MSRNFELLSQAGKIEECLGPLEPQQPESMPEARASAPALEFDGTAREEVAKLVYRLFVSSGADAAHCVVFTAAELGDGCSWMCAHAAEVLASQGRGSVCVVDCNLRNPSLHEHFNVGNQHGVTDALRYPNRIHQFASQLSRPNLWLLSAGSASQDWQENLSSDRMRSLMASLRAEFDYVLIDAAALNLGNDAIVLSNLADGAALVLKAHYTRRESARKAVHDLKVAGIRVLGAILNQRTFPVPDSIYNRL